MPKPPALTELLDDPVYKAYMRTPPPLTNIYAGTEHKHPLLNAGQPWQVWLHTTEGKWKTGKFDTYARAFNTLARAHKAGVASDIVLVSRRVFFGPPGHWEQYRVRVKKPGHPKGVIETRHRWIQEFHWEPSFEWCARCRRPTEFRQLHWTHHALRTQPCLTTDEPYRCTFCGIRRIALPALETLR